MDIKLSAGELLERFLRYVKVNTRSNPENMDQIPSSQNQVDFAHQLEDELNELGLSDVYYNDADSYVTATLPATDTESNYPTIGFFAHRDTADFNAENIQPQVVENYDGGVIKLSDSGYELSPEDFPSLNKYKGQTLITTDGRTLLGADDKSGIAEIMTAIAYLIDHPEIKHGDIKIAFGPDEEIGMGATRFDVERFGADFAFTVDGGPLGDLEYETFTAAQANVKITGKSVHPSEAKNIMINALQVGMDFHNAISAFDRPEYTEDREGFYFLDGFEGTSDEARMSYIIRDHDSHVFEYRKHQMEKIAEVINSKYPQKVIDIEIVDQYRNMREILEKDMRPVTLAKKSYKAAGVTPNIQPVRGGTDGSILTFRGLPTPNLFAGGENMHARFEYVSLETMVKMSEIIIRMVTIAKDYEQF
ncbi:MAG: peptidase T [Aerococcus sp.]|nr:peptidase T [Aerococcus sp.]